MGKSFLTQIEAYNKLGLSGGGISLSQNNSC
ncbi:MAG: hypothetical protein PARBA_03161 [Parabacteroides sp.]